jgi:sialic acid synthase
MLRELTIDGQRIADDTDCYVIAEIGHNHQGDLDKARQLFLRAKECGVRAVKLQKRDNRSLYTKAMYDRPYEHENSFGRTYGEHREVLEFGREEYLELQAYARQLGLTFFATAFDVPSADFLARLDVPAYKIASGDIRNLPLLRHVAGLQKPMIISTGGATLAEVDEACQAILPLNSRLCVLQCTAYMLGARVIEKHFTLNHTWKGTDHALSLEPIGMHKMIRDLQRARIALGDGVKRMLPSEAGAVMKMGKKLVATRGLPAGHVLAEGDIAVKSPGDGLPPAELERIVGRTLLQALAADDGITLEMLAPAGEPVQPGRA